MNFSNTKGDEVFQMLVVHRFCIGNDTLQPSANVLQEGQRLVSQTKAGPWRNLPPYLVTKLSFNSEDKTLCCGLLILDIEHI